MNELTLVLQTFFIAVLLTAIGELFGIRTPLLRRTALPGAVLGGLIGLIGMPFLSEHRQVLSQFPALFINVVFACLLLGKRVGSLSKVWERAHPHIITGHIIAWGQYVTGLTLTLFLLSPLLSINPLVAPSIAIGFQGGHGTAAGLTQSFESLGFAEGKTIAYSIATFGIIFGSIFGPLLAAFLSRKTPVEDQTASPENPPRKPEPRQFSPLTGKLTLHLALIGLVITAGWALLRGIQQLEKAVRGPDADPLFSEYIPLFSVVLIAGFVMQIVLQRFDLDLFFDRKLFNTVSSFGLDMVIVSALATLSLGIVREYWLVITLLTLAGLGWNLLVFFLLGPRLFPKPWHVYALGDLGGGTATTASGLLLIRTADPQHKTYARQSYSEKQPFYEPLMGGGLVTAMALPLISMLGVIPCLLITTGILAAWIVYALILIKKKSA